jgi:plastocyanin
MKRLAFVLLALAACGGDDNNSTPDAPPVSIDAPPSTVQAVTCPTTPAATVMTSGSAYAPMTTNITQGQIVQFVMPASHNVVPGHNVADGTIADTGLNVNFNETKCFMFTQTGMYGFHCGPHSFNGTIVVQ